MSASQVARNIGMATGTRPLVTLGLHFQWLLYLVKFILNKLVCISPVNLSLVIRVVTKNLAWGEEKKSFFL
jgi:hypothetical protein